MKKTRFLSLALTGTLCVSLLAGCGGSGDGGGAAQTPDAANTSTVQENTGSAFKLGGTGPLTGDAAIYGLAAQRGAQIAVDEIKEAGGDIQFALKYEDDVNVPETAVNAYNALKEWGMQISLGSVTSQPGVSTSALAFEDRIFTMTPSGSSPDVISGKDNVYQMCFSDPNQGLASAQYITEQGLGEKVFIIWKNDDVYSTGIKEQFVKEAETLGLEVVGDATFTTDTATDFSVQLTQAQQAGADLVVGSLIKNPGGGLAPTGGYIAGRRDLVEGAAMRLTTPGIGKECGSTFGANRSLYQGLFLAPHTTAQAVKTAVFAARMMELLGYRTEPTSDTVRHDIIQMIHFGAPEPLKKFCKGIQFGAPVDSFVTPEPWDMPGYDCPVIMAAGAFIQGASIELSCDAPMREPYTAYLQGGLTYESGKAGVLLAVEELLRGE